MPVEFLKRDYEVGDVTMLPIGSIARREREHAIDEKITSSDPGFLTTVWENLKSSTLVNAIYEGKAGPKFGFDRYTYGLNSKKTERIYQDAEDYDESYDWRNDAEKYEGAYPKEVFEGSYSSLQTNRSMQEYDSESYKKSAMQRRPVASFIGGLGAFGTDLAALHYVPFVGGFNARVVGAAGKVTSNSILKGAVSGSVAFALDITEVELARAMLDERVTLGEVADNLPTEVMYGALLGGTIGAVGGSIKGRSGKASLESKGNFEFKEKILRQIDGGTKLPSGDSIGGKTYHTSAEYVTEVDRLAKEYFVRLREVSPVLSLDNVKTLISVIGGVEESSVTETSSKSMLSKLASDPTTRAYGSEVSFVRDMARKLHDNHLLNDVPSSGELTQSLDITVQILQNEIQGKSKLILDGGYQKYLADLNNSGVGKSSQKPMSRDEFNQLVGRTLPNNGTLPAGYLEFVSQHIEATAGRYIQEVRDPVQEAFIKMKKLQDGPKLVEEAKKGVITAEETFKKVSSEREKYGSESLEKNIKQQHSLELAKAKTNDLFKPDKAIEKSRVSEANNIRLRYESLREAVRTTSFDRMSEFEDIIDNIESLSGHAKKSTTKRAKSSIEKTTSSTEDMISRLDKAEAREIKMMNDNIDSQIKRSKKFSEDTMSSVRENLEKRAFAIEGEFSEAEVELKKQMELLKEREGGTFESDLSGWLQNNDQGYTHRMYDYQKIMSAPDAFVKDVSERLISLEGLSETTASELANAMYNELITTPVGRRFATKVTLRGAERSRTFKFSTEVVENWIATDAQKMSERWAKSVIPDSIIQEKLGTFDAKTFEVPINDEILQLVKSGKVLASDANSLLHTSISQIQRMIDNIRGLEYMPGGMLADATAWRASSSIRSLQSIVSLGGLVFTSIFDAASTVLNKGLFRTIEHDGTTLIKYIFKKSFRDAVKGSSDLTSMSGWLEGVLRKGSNRTLSEHAIPVNYMTRTTEFLKRASRLQQKITGAEAIFNSMHIASDYGNLLSIGKIAEKVYSGNALSATERNLLNLSRISDSRILKIADQINKFATVENGVKHFNFARWEDINSASSVKYGVNALTKNSILLPGTEVPMFARTPIGEVMLQYKKFLFSAVDRCFLPAVGRLSSGEISILSRVFAMVAMGGLKEIFSRLSSGRDMVTFDEFWEAGIGNCDALPLIGEIIKDVHSGFNSKGLTGGFSGAKNWIQSFFVPPAVSQATRVLTAANGVSAIMSGQRRNLTMAEASAIKSSIPYNNTIYFNRLLNKFLKGLVGDGDLNFNIKS